MNIKQKSTVWTAAMNALRADTAFGQQILLATEVAKALELRVAFGDGLIELRRRGGVYPGAVICSVKAN